MNLIHLSLYFLLFSIITGCKTSEPRSYEPEKAYTVRAVFIEVPEVLLRKQNLLWMLDSSRVVTAAESKELMEKLCSSPKARLTEFPVVYVNVGERKKIDKQSPVKYPTTYDENGKPTDYMTRGIGLLIDIDLESVTNGLAQFSYHIEDVANPTWTSYSYKIGTSSRKMKLPIFNNRTIESSDITLPLNSWIITGGLVTALKDGTKRNMITGIQVQETKKAQPPAPH